MVKIIGNGAKHLKKGVEYTVTEEVAEVLVSKGLATFEGQTPAEPVKAKQEVKPEPTKQPIPSKQPEPVRTEKKK